MNHPEKKGTARQPGVGEPRGCIAIVDDDEPVRCAVSRLLATYSLIVRTYASAGEFLESLKTAAPACLILDMEMPDMTGLELLRHLTVASFIFPIIIVTASDELGLEQKCMRAGARAFMRKPLPGEHLIQTVLAAVAAQHNGGGRSEGTQA